MNNLFYHIFLIFSFVFVSNGLCEDFCYNNTCDDLNGNFNSECSDCPITYKCNTFLNMTHKIFPIEVKLNI